MRGGSRAEPEARAETGTPVTVSDILRYAWYAGMAVLALWFLAANIAFRARLTRSARRMEYPGCKLPLYVSGAVETPAICKTLREHGAVMAQMTGSGAAVFGVFRDEASAQAAVAAARQRWKQVYLARPDRGGARVI